MIFSNPQRKKILRTAGTKINEFEKSMYEENQQK